VAIALLQAGELLVVATGVRLHAGLSDPILHARHRVARSLQTLVLGCAREQLLAMLCDCRAQDERGLLDVCCQPAPELADMQTVHPVGARVRPTDKDALVAHTEQIVRVLLVEVS